MFKAINLIILPRSMAKVPLTLQSGVEDVRHKQPDNFSMKWLRFIGDHKLGSVSYVCEEREDLRFFQHANCLHISSEDQVMATGSRPAIRIKPAHLQELILDMERWETSLSERRLIEFCDGSRMEPTSFRRA